LVSLRQSQPEAC